ncbi:sigma-70 family RNA polymerase sigma factor [Olivibacter sitiensis]|uniref:sigma-70 family RNA polymerase sigma factor n=1 Tax=Olivibacter sitiensis TaxID=376470 RepID=UPI00040955AA|nr:sigma-70 family RNA polymerase sigma factor [Olivibacter sitiensis]
MSVFNKEEEKKLLEQIKLGNQSAFEILYQKCWLVLFNQAYKRVKNEELVKGMIQELFTELWIRRDKLNVRDSLLSYLHSALKYKVFNYYKSQIVKEKYLDAKKSTLNHEYSSSTDEDLNYKELQLAFNRCVSTMPGQPQKVYLMRYDKSMSYAEIAKELNISISTVEKHMIKALRIIHEKLRFFFANY